MKNNHHMLLASVLFFALANNASAANKTHVTDVLGTGNSRVDISYGIGNFTGTSNTVYANGATPTHYDANGTGSAISTAYLLGITDRLDMGITFPVSSSSSSSYTGSSSHTFKYEGQGDMTISASYLIKDKKENEVGWNLYGAISPPTAPSESSSYSSTTGTTTGKPGKGYSSNRIGTTISIPSTLGDTFLQVEYEINGERSYQGFNTKIGNKTSLTAGIEHMLDEDLTLTPFAMYASYSPGYGGTSTLAIGNIYTLGLRVTKDMSKSISLKFDTSYVMSNDTVVTYSIGDKTTSSTTAYSVGLSALIFF